MLRDGQRISSILCPQQRGHPDGQQLGSSRLVCLVIYRFEASSSLCTCMVHAISRRAINNLIHRTCDSVSRHPVWNWSHEWRDSWLLRSMQAPYGEDVETLRIPPPRSAVRTKSEAPKAPCNSTQYLGAFVLHWTTALSSLPLTHPPGCGTNRTTWAAQRSTPSEMHPENRLDARPHAMRLNKMHGFSWGLFCAAEGPSCCYGSVAYWTRVKRGVGAGQII
ncbi:uncharacterized protein EI97DRAFT_273227 [Westerdykella ornata]|uniref:Uncharacterized protein n=1 Tax=Westerdykella ornata TaxID=318751 RepID=A0A6A6JMN8_WESOR|nr:uncharacterized protein EI97DRAFT_273227 [Westerdykella ornata]KAF2277787.1 hypothetical protein EI97DRAFT_273227 [Westerdykella ornata]